VSNSEFYEERKISGTTKQLLCLNQQDPSYFLEIRVCDPVKGTSKSWFFCGIQRVYTFMILSLPDGAAELTCLHLDSSTRLVYVIGGVGFYVASRVGVDEPLNPLVRTHPLVAAEAYNVEEDK